MSELSGLALHERAEKLGLTSKGLIELARRDPRVVDDLALEGGGFERLRRYIAVGMPTPNLDALVVESNDDRAFHVVRATVAKLPEPVQQHATNGVVFVGMGNDVAGWCSYSPPPLQGRHLIALKRIDGETIAHELAHSWAHSPDDATKTLLTTAEKIRVVREISARLIREGGNESTAVREYMRRQVNEERHADALASLWLSRSIRGEGVESFMLSQFHRNASLAGEETSE